MLFQHFGDGGAAAKGAIETVMVNALLGEQGGQHGAVSGFHGRREGV